MCFIIIIIEAADEDDDEEDVTTCTLHVLEKHKILFQTLINFPFHSSNKLSLHHQNQFLGFTQNHCIGVSLMKRHSGLNKRVLCERPSAADVCVCGGSWVIHHRLYSGFMIQKTRTNINYLHQVSFNASVTHTLRHAHRRTDR